MSSNAEQKLSMAAQDKAVTEAAGYVRDTIKPFTDAERRSILDAALRELNSELTVSIGGIDHD